MGGLGLTFVMHHKQKKRFVMSSEESTRASTHALGRAWAANNCYKKKNPFTTTFYCSATTFNMNAAKSQHQSHDTNITRTAKALHLLRLHTRNKEQLPFVRTGRPNQFSNGMLSSVKRNSLVMRKSLSSEKKLTGSIWPGCCWLVETNSKLLSALTIIL